MKRAMRKRLLAMILSLMLAIPATAMASNDPYMAAQETVETSTEIAAEESLETPAEEVVQAEEVEASETEAEEIVGEETEEAEEELDAVEEPSAEEEESSEEESSEEPEEQIPDGLLEKDGKIYYYENNEMVLGLKTVEVDGKNAIYYFDQDGAAVTGYKRVAEADGGYAYYYFMKNGQAYTDGFLEFVGTDDETYYFYFQKDGKAFTEGYKSVKTMHKVDGKGKIVDISDGKSYKYYFRTNGRAYNNGLLQFVHTDGKTYRFYFQADGKAFNSGLKKAKKVYAADEAGKITNIGDGSYHYYYFQSNANAFNKGMLEIPNEEGKSYYYFFQSNGQGYTNGYKATKKIYKAKSDCTVKKVSDDTTYYYYFRTNGRAYMNGFLEFTHTNGKVYDFYFQEDGKAYTNGNLMILKRYKMGADGKLIKMGDGVKHGYTFNKKGQGSLITGWEKIGDTWGWFNKSTGVREFSSNAMHTAWNSIKDRSSGTSYYVVVDTANCLTFTFKGSANNWTPLFLWKCSPGKPSTPTVKGTYSIYGRGYSFSGKEDYTCYYYTQFYGNYLFHSVLYHKGTFNIRNGTLGKQLSHGCVRLAIENAKWFYDNLGYGTKVYIY